MTIDPACLKDILYFIRDNVHVNNFKAAFDNVATENNQALNDLVKMYDKQTIIYHLRYLYESGDISAFDFKLDRILIGHLTPSGHSKL